MSILTIGVGTAANDGTGDSIRLAFEKTNTNFAYLLGVTQNLSTANLVAGGTNANITLNSGVPSYWTGTFYLNGFQLATTNTLFSGGAVANPTTFVSTAQSASTTSGQSVLVAGGLGVAGTAYIGNLNTYSATLTSTLTAATVQASTGNYSTLLTAPQITVLSGAGTITTIGNISAGSAYVLGFQAQFTNLTGTLLTNAQPYINSLGNLTLLNVAGNVNAGNLTANGTVQSGYLVSLSNTSVGGNLIVGSNTILTGNVTAGNVSASIGTFANATVNNYPSNFHVVNKGYVNSTALAFAIATGS